MKPKSSDQTLRETSSRNGVSSMSSGSQSVAEKLGGGEDCLMTAVEAARLLNLKNVGTIYHLVNQKRIPVVKLSARCIRFSRTALLEWIDSLSQSVNPNGV